MSLVNLLPPDIRQRQQTRRVAFLIAAAGIGVLLLVVFAYLLEVQSLSSVRGDIEDQQAQNANLQTSIAALQKYADLQTEADAKQQLLAAVFADELSFSGALVDVSRVIPSDAVLTSLTITVNPAASATTGVPGTILGTIAFTGEGANAESVAALLGRLENVRGWVNPFVTSVARPGLGDIVQFTGTVDLTVDALTPRGREGAIAAGLTA
jgi:Tfp pilus assembly protein PilN